jgi:hypothetical protein
MKGKLIGVSQFLEGDAESYRGKFTLFKVGRMYLDRVTQLEINKPATIYTDAFVRIQDFTSRRKSYPVLEFIYDD